MIHFKTSYVQPLGKTGCYLYEKNGCSVHFRIDRKHVAPKHYRYDISVKDFSTMEVLDLNTFSNSGLDRLQCTLEKYTQEWLSKKNRWGNAYIGVSIHGLCFEEFQGDNNFAEAVIEQYLNCFVI